VKDFKLDAFGKVHFKIADKKSQLYSGDRVLVAVGQAPVVPRGRLMKPPRAIEVNPETLESSVQGVFAGGDAVKMPGTVSEALGFGNGPPCPLTVSKRLPLARIRPHGLWISMMSRYRNS